MPYNIVTSKNGVKKNGFEQPTMVHYMITCPEYSILRNGDEISSQF